MEEQKLYWEQYRKEANKYSKNLATKVKSNRESQILLLQYWDKGKFDVTKIILNLGSPIVFSLANSNNHLYSLEQETMMGYSTFLKKI